VTLDIFYGDTEENENVFLSEDSVFAVFKLVSDLSLRKLRQRHVYGIRHARMWNIVV